MKYSLTTNKYISSQFKQKKSYICLYRSPKNEIDRLNLTENIRELLVVFQAYICYLNAEHQKLLFRLLDLGNNSTNDLNLNHYSMDRNEIVPSPSQWSDLLNSSPNSTTESQSCLNNENAKLTKSKHSDALVRITCNEFPNKIIKSYTLNEGTIQSDFINDHSIDYIENNDPNEASLFVNDSSTYESSIKNENTNITLFNSTPVLSSLSGNVLDIQSKRIETTEHGHGQKSMLRNHVKMKSTTIIFLKMMYIRISVTKKKKKIFGIEFNRQYWELLQDSILRRWMDFFGLKVKNWLYVYGITCCYAKSNPGSIRRRNMINELTKISNYLNDIQE